MPSETENRVNYVGQQKDIEAQAALGGARSSAVFFVQDLPTPAFIAPGGSIPPGLIPEAKLKDEAQLRTALDRVKTFHDMLERGVHIDVYCVNKRRGHAGDSHGALGEIDHRHFEELLQRYPDNLRIHAIDSSFYDAHKVDVPAASYSYPVDAGMIRSVVYASQINTPHNPVPWGLHSTLATDPDARAQAERGFAALAKVRESYAAPIPPWLSAMAQPQQPPVAAQAAHGMAP